MLPISIALPLSTAGFEPVTLEASIADGFLTLHGREQDLINRGGEKISPLEIDHALLRHPEVAEAAAFAIPHRRLGEDIAAAVVLKEGARADPNGSS